MTEGNPVRIIMAFAVPLFIGNVFQQIYNLVDTMITGHFLGDGAALATVIVLLTATKNREIIENALFNLRLSTACFFPLCALFLGVFYVTIGHQKQTEEGVGR